MTSDTQADFLDRFEHLRKRIRRVNVAAALSTALAAVVAAVALVALADYRYELEWNARAAALAAAGFLVAAWLARRVWQIVAHWSRPRTAGELEDRFPELGQRLRTAVQYGRRDTEFVRREGVAPSLVEALEADTSERSGPLPLDRVVPARRCYAAALGAALAALVLLASTRTDGQWRTAVRRALLAEVPYTTLTVLPGNADVIEGDPLAITAALSGRTDRTVTLLSRPAGQTGTAWSEQVLSRSRRSRLPGGTGSEVAAESPDPARQAGPTVYSAELPKITQPLEYRVVAGPAASEVFQIGVRYPLAIQEVAVEIEPPQYTGLPAATFTDGNVTALSGSRARFRVTLDRPPAEAEALVRRVGVLEEGEDREFRVPLEADGPALTWSLELTRDVRWSLAARSQDGTDLPENVFRIRVREDQPPRVGFESPDDFTEVHTLAEVLMRIRASDDYGLTRAGIVFQINNNEEHTLLQEDFAAVAAALENLDSPARAPRTRSVLERVLPLEHFLLTQKDCVIYYAFAEDNFPGGPHRAESELRFIDIRPFKQTFRLREPGEGGMGGGRFTSLGELIQRQRNILNSTIRLDRRPARASDRDLGTVDRLVSSQAELADLTREFAEFLIDRGADDVDMLFQAEAAMLNAVDSLSIGKYDTAVLQEKDAQQYLVEARNALEILLAEAQNNATLRQALAMFDRRLRQRLRRDREDRDQTAQSLVERLRRLAAAEADVCRQCAAAAQAFQAGTGTASAAAGGEPAPGDPQTDRDDPPATADAASETAPSPAAAADPRQLEERQYDIVAEAQEIEQALAGMRRVTPLAAERMRASVERADQAAGTLARGDTAGAARETGEAAMLFAEVAEHLAALLASEAPERVALARNMTAGLADRERRLAERLADPAPDAADASREMRRDQPGAERDDRLSASPQAERLAERARTIDDVLTAIARSPRIEDSEAADRIAELLLAQNVPATLERVQQLAERLGPQSSLPAALAELGDTADRLDVAARELDRIYRSLVAPRLEQLRDLEREAAALQERMARLETTGGIRQWQQSLEDLLEKLEQAGAGGPVREELAERAAQGELPPLIEWRRTADSPFYSVPAFYQSRVPLLVDEVQRQIQEIILTDLLADRDEPTPPGYQHLVDRYLKVLSGREASKDE